SAKRDWSSGLCASDLTLERPEQLASLHYLVERLPEFTETVRSVEDKLDFVQSVLSDKQSLQSMSEEAEKKIDSLQIGQEHLDAKIGRASCRRRGGVR